ncbi:hypothetical protein CO659_22120 [Rhizobium sp. S9]|uniref:hypothetical protein n=1 Tax=unclassified Rhizobium TaxID=2613769 RepID=UPI000A210547|nr:MULTISPECIES: hypothetical protein [unclassified Rhizobium]ARO22194.1 hypothetical protein TAL182_CH00366 [Rhizobium sp. TAL182]PDS95711.1 hypothetical protein CO659_22120 [Rhizobium sp. S9]
MPLNAELRDKVLSYSDQYLPSAEQVGRYFDFIDKIELRAMLASEFLAARYIYKLGEALNVSDQKLAAHAKFQIVQYASIYEAVIVYILWSKFASSDEVTAIEYYSAFRKATSVPKDISITTANDEEVFLCIETRRKNTQHSIKFDDKVDAAVSIGFVDQKLGEEIKEFYRLRNGIHIENALKNEINYELQQSLLAYRRIKPFTIGVREFLRSGTLPEEARPKSIQESEPDDLGLGE